METDYLIVGQGICGTMLSWELLREGCSVLVIDDGNKATASRTACGLINPVTGMRHVKSWRFDEFMDVTTQSYGELGVELGLKLLQEKMLLHFFKDNEEQQVFEERVNQGAAHIYFLEEAEVWSHYFQSSHKVGVVQPCYMLSLPLMLQAWRKRLENSGSLIAEQFNYKELKIEGGKVNYNGACARKIIFCDGIFSLSNPFFDNLPFSRNKGEALIVSIPDLPPDYLYMNEYKIAPWRDGLFWIGSTFEWKHEDAKPTDAFRNDVKKSLQNWLKIPFEIIEHLAAERPSTFDYHPFLGLHPLHPEVGIFNGQGTKGCSQTPYFAKQMKELMLQGKPVLPEADLQRVFSKKKK